MTEPLNHQPDLLESLFDHLPVGVAVLDAELVLHRCNPTWAQFVQRCSGIAAARVVPGRPIAELLPDTAETSLQRYRRALAGETVREEGARVRSGGTLTYWDVALVPLVENDRVVGIFDVTVDANERCRAVAALQQHHDHLEEMVAARTAEMAAVNRRLEEALAERQRAEAALRASEEQYRELVENANSIIFRMDPRGNIVFFNEFAERFFGFGPADILGRSALGTVIPRRNAEGTDLSQFLADLCRNPERYTTHENENVRADGERVWIAWTNRAVRDAQGRLTEILCVGNDVTARRRAEEELQRAHDELERRVEERTGELTRANEVLQQEVAERQRAEEQLRRRVAFEKLISSISSNFINLAPEQVDEGINQTLRAVGEFAAVDRCYVFLYAPDGKTSSNTHEWCAEGVGPQKGNFQLVPVESTPWFTEQMLSQKVIYLESLDDLPPEAAVERQVLGDQSILSLVAVPMVYRNATVGFLGFDSVRQEARWPEESIAQLRLTGEIIVNALERKGSEDELRAAYQTLEQRVQERTAELSTILSVQQAISSRLDPERMLQMIADEARRLTDTAKAVVYMVEGEELRISVLSGDLDPSMMGMRIPLHGSVVGTAALTGQAQISLAAATDPCSHMETVQRAASRDVLAVPLVYGERTIGVIALANKANGILGSEDVRKLTTLAAGAAIDLENARLFREEQERRQEAEQRRQVAEGLRDIVAVLNSNRPLQEILEHIVGQACRVVGTETGALLRLQEDGQTLAVQASQGLPPEYVPRISVLVGTGAVGRAVAERMPIAIPDYSVAAPASGSLGELLRADPGLASRLRAILAVPLLVKNELYGGIVLYFPQPREFSEEEVALAVTFADQAALAIENARLRDRAEQLAVAAERSRLARDLHDAVTQTLFSASLIAEVLPRLWERNQDEGRRRLEELRQLTRGALAEMRTLLLELRPTALTEAALGDLLKQLAEAVTGRARLPVALTVECQRTLPPEVQLALYRIAQEALNNVVKHSGASRVEISLRCLGDTVELAVSDDGRGFDVAAVPPDHLGLGIMRERAETIGASLGLRSAPGRGTRVAVVWQDT